MFIVSGSWCSWCRFAWYLKLCSWCWVSHVLPSATPADRCMLRCGWRWCQLEYDTRINYILVWGVLCCVLLFCSCAHTTMTNSILQHYCADCTVCTSKRLCLCRKYRCFEQVGNQVFEHARRLLDAEGRGGDAVAVQVSFHACVCCVEIMSSKRQRMSRALRL